MLLFLGLGKKKLAFSFSFPIPNPPWWYILYHLDGMLLSWWYISHRNGLWWCCFQPKNSTWWYISSTLLGKWSSHEHFNALKSSWNGIWWVYPTTKSHSQPETLKMDHVSNPKHSIWSTYFGLFNPKLSKWSTCFNPKLSKWSTCFNPKLPKWSIEMEPKLSKMVLEIGLFWENVIFPENGPILRKSRLSRICRKKFFLSVAKDFDLTGQNP